MSFSVRIVGICEESRSFLCKTRYCCKIVNIGLVERHTHVNHVCSTWIVGATTSKAHIISGSCPGHTSWERSTSNTWIYSIEFLLFSIMDSQTYQAEMEQWKEDLRAARDQVSMRALSNSHFT